VLEIRIHGRGGQGNVVAAYLLASAAFEVGKACQAFPNFGAERRGAPVTAFVRIDDHVIKLRSQVRTPDHLIIQDPSLLQVPGVLSGLRDGGGIVVNTERSLEEMAATLGRPALVVPATRLSTEFIGRPLPNVALLAAFLAATQAVPLTALETALEHRFKGDVLKRNLKLVRRTADTVPAGCWRDGVVALGTPAAADDDTAAREAANA